MLPFVKMHGCGNDFVIVREKDLPEPGPLAPEELARRACAPHFGLGADGLIVYGPQPSQEGAPRLRMRYWNADGSRAEMCGNGARCVIRLAYERGETGSPLVLETDTRTHHAAVELQDGRVGGVRVDMGPPAWEPDAGPLAAAAPWVDTPVEVQGVELRVSALSIGNPHAVVFVPDRSALGRVPLASWGRALAEHPLFPRGANVSFVVESGGELHLRVWERGVGPTLACGTAACAALAAAVRLGRLPGRRARVHLPGGGVEVWLDEAGDLWLAGPAAYVAEGALSADLLQPPPAL